MKSAVSAGILILAVATCSVAKAAQPSGGWYLARDFLASAVLRLLRRLLSQADAVCRTVLLLWLR